MRSIEEIESKKAKVVSQMEKVIRIQERKIVSVGGKITHLLTISQTKPHDF